MHYGNGKSDRRMTYYMSREVSRHKLLFMSMLFQHSVFFSNNRKFRRMILRILLDHPIRNLFSKDFYADASLMIRGFLITKVLLQEKILILILNSQTI
jgi:hypothetical protein